VDRRLLMAWFEGVVDEYDAGRPEYPAAVFDALEPLAGLRVVDGGAGTGIATRALVERGAEVVAIDLGANVLARAAERSPGVQAAVADGARLPLPDGCVDLLCFAQSWHWLDPTKRVAEAHRVLRPTGRWAAWWSHAWADGEPWFDEYWSVLERAFPGTHRSQRTTDWGALAGEGGLLEVGAPVIVPWVRRLTVDAWMTDQASHSYIASLPAARAADVLDELRAVLAPAFPDGAMAVRYETWLWVALRR
jgi:SAM-dependent methyltransferase